MWCMHSLFAMVAKSKTVLVTGGSGLVGHGIQSFSRKNKNDVDWVFWSSKDCDLEDMTKTCAKIKEVSPDVVIHLAACVGGLFRNMNERTSMLERNLLMNMAVLRACHEADVTRVISCLSTCIFPDKIEYPISEEHLHAGPPHESNEGYAYAKRMLAVQSQTYRKQYNREYMCVIPTNVYGPHDNFDLQDAHVVPALIHKCYLATKRNEPFVALGSGTPLRQFVHADDLGEVIARVALMPVCPPELLIIAPDEKDEVSIRDIVEMIARLFDRQDAPSFDTTKADGQYKKTAANAKLRALFPDFQFRSFETGMRDTVTWFRESLSDGAVRMRGVSERD